MRLSSIRLSPENYHAASTIYSIRGHIGRFQPDRQCKRREIKAFEDKEDEYRQLIRESERGVDEKYYRNRDTFDALTDGQYGDYDDFGGDIGSLKDSLGL